jgi:hypothetical protein
MHVMLYNTHESSKIIVNLKNLPAEIQKVRITQFWIMADPVSFDRILDPDT